MSTEYESDLLHVSCRLRHQNSIFTGDPLAAVLCPGSTCGKMNE